ncbi:MAG: hypothetical protein RB296_06315 [Acidobacteriota bacterium]|nr:hypothetical protein [Acidobacteriota bacterium]
MIFRIGLIGLVLACSGMVQAGPDWEKIHLTDLSGYGLFAATSELSAAHTRTLNARTRYGPANLVDGDLFTPWVEGRPDAGIGESVFVVVPENCRRLNIFPGHGRSRELFSKNNRPSRLEVTFHAGIHCDGEVTETALLFHTRRFEHRFLLELKDEFRRQTFSVPASSTELAEFLEQSRREFNAGFERPVARVVLIVELKILDVFRGTHWDDTCISEVFAQDRFIPDGMIRYPRVTRVYVPQEFPGTICMDTKEKTGVIVAQDIRAVSQVGEVSADGRWATIMQLPAAAPPGRVETVWRLLDLRRVRFVEDELAQTWGSEVFGPFFLQQESGSLFLEHASGRIRLY